MIFGIVFISQPSFLISESTQNKNETFNHTIHSNKSVIFEQNSLFSSTFMYIFGVSSALLSSCFASGGILKCFTFYNLYDSNSYSY
jgi:hypothetical protein